MSETEPARDVTREILLDVAIDPGVETARIQGRRIRIPAGVAPGRHTHNGPVVGTVTAGRVRFQVLGEPERVLEPGDAFYEPAETVIEHFDAMPDADLEFVAWFPVPGGAEPQLRPA